MKICDHNGYEMLLPTSGGKAGKGNQVTSSIQVRSGNAIKANFRFRLDNPASRSRAIQKAKDYTT